MIDVQLVLNLGIIGYRKHAGKLISFVEERSDSQIKFIFHPTKIIEDERFTNNFSDLLECDAIIISSPNDTHFEYIERTIENFSGYILCEKPPVTKIEELKKLETLTDDQKKRIFFNFMFRHSKLNNLLKDETLLEKIGKFIHIDLVMSKGLAFKSEYLDSWRSDGKNNLHNILDANTIHHIDLLSFHLGKIKKSFYIPSLISKKGTSFDTSYVILTYENDLSVSIFNSYATPLINELSIIGENGHCVIREGKLKIFSPRDTFDNEGLFISPPKIHEEEFTIEDDIQDSLRNSLEFFILKAINKEEIPIEYFNTSISTNKIILELKKFDRYLEK